MTRPRVSARDLARLLVAGGVDSLCRELLPTGHREGAEWVAPSICGSSRRGLSVHLFGNKAGVFAEFDGTAKGDAFDLVAHVLFGGDKKKAYAWAMVRTRMRNGAAPARVAAPPRPAASEPDAYDRVTTAEAWRLFLSAQPDLRGTWGERYLADRGVPLAELGRQPRSLRFHPACRCTEIGSPLPALLAAVCGPDGKHVSTHRTWLAERDGKIVKAPLKAAKKSYGSLSGGTIRLWRGRSRKPLAQAPESDTVVISEGIENGLSCALACPEFRVLAAVSLGNLGAVVLPPHLLDIIIAADNDQGNPAAEAGLQRAADRLLAEGRSVRIARSSTGKDFNDGIKAE